MAVYFILTVVFTVVTALLGGLLCKAVGHFIDHPAAKRPVRDHTRSTPVRYNRAA